MVKHWTDMDYINKTFAWVVLHMPPPKYDARFYPYGYVFKEAYGYKDNRKAGAQVRRDLEEYIIELCSAHHCAVQLGVHLNGTRGIRIMNIAL